MNKILAYNYWLDKGYKRLFSHNIEETIQLTFKKIIESFPDSDDIDVKKTERFILGGFIQLELCRVKVIVCHRIKQ